MHRLTYTVTHGQGCAYKSAPTTTVSSPAYIHPPLYKSTCRLHNLSGDASLCQPTHHKTQGVQLPEQSSSQAFPRARRVIVATHKHLIVFDHSHTSLAVPTSHHPHRRCRCCSHHPRRRCHHSRCHLVRRTPSSAATRRAVYQGWSPCGCVLPVLGSRSGKDKANSNR